MTDGAGRQGVDGPVSGEGGLGQLERGLVEIDLALSLVELGLVGPGIDHEQQVPRLDLLPFLERHLDQVAGDPGADVHRVDRLGPAGEVDKVGDLPPDGLADRHRRRWPVFATFFDSPDGDAFLGSSDWPDDSMGTRSGLTVIRGRTCCNPPKTTQSSGLSPCSMIAQSVVLRRPGRDPAILGLVFRVEHVDVFEPLVRPDGALDDQQGRMGLADRQPDPHEHARR